MKLFRSVCLIDDEESLSEIFSENLGDHFLIKVYNAAQDALKDIEEGYRPDVIVTDLRMPKFSGFDFLQTLETMEWRAPVVVISSSIRSHEMEALMAHPIFSFVEKPFLMDDLIKQINKASQWVFRSPEKAVPPLNLDNVVSWCDFVKSKGHCKICK